MQAKDIPDETVLEAVRQTQGMHSVPNWSTLWDVRDKLPQVPPKVVQAKLRSLIKRRLLEGCACGCRGDFEFPVAH